MLKKQIHFNIYTTWQNGNAQVKKKKNDFKQYIKEYFLKQKDEMTNKKRVYLQHNGECVCHHLNRPERVHNIF